jgi:hypothetical protein
MSAGAFLADAKYESNNGSVHAIRVQPETLQLSIGGTANASPAGDVDSPFRARVGRSNGGYGLKPRAVTVRFTGTPPTGYKAGETYRVPVMQSTLWDTANAGTVCEYLGVAGVVVSTSPESIR